MPFPAFAQDYVERVASDTPGGPWTEEAGDMDVVIAPNGRGGFTDGTPGVADAFANNGTDLPSSDMWIQGQVWDWTGVNNFAALGIATRVNAGAGFSGLVFSREADTLGDRMAFRDWSSATVTASSPFDAAVAFPGVGERIRLESAGPHHRVMSNGIVQAQILDATFPTAKRVGLHVYRQTSGFTTALGQLLYGSFANVPVFTNRAASSNTTDAATFATASVTPASGSLVLIAFVHSFGSATPKDADTVTGSSISGAARVLSLPYNTVATPRSKLEIWAAVGTGSAGAITVAFNGAGGGGSQTQTGLAWSVDEVTNINTARGTNGVLQSASNAAAAATAYASGSLVGPDEGYNAVYGATSIAVNSSITVSAAHTRLSDVGYATPTQRLATDCFTFFDQSWGNSGASSEYGSIIVELASKISWSPFIAPGLYIPARLPVMAGSLR